MLFRMGFLSVMQGKPLLIGILINVRRI